MKRLFEALGVDYAQWKALTLVALKVDFRARTFGGARRRRKPGTRGVIIGQVIFYTVIGLMMAFTVWSVPDRFVAALVLFSYVLLMVGTAVLVDHTATVTSASDYAILGFQPIDSRTYFAARLTNVLVYTLATTTAVGLLPAVVFYVRHGAAAGLAATLALYACALTVTLAILVGYASLVRITGVRRLRSFLSYVQLTVGFLLYGGYFLVSEVVSSSALSSLTISRTPWLMLYPGTWFACYVELAAGGWAARDLLPVLGSIALLMFLATRLRGRLTLEYTDQLAALASASTDVRSRSAAPKPGLWFRGGEARAVAILVRSQFRNDLKFRMGVLGILPLTILYLLMGLRRGDGSIGTRAAGDTNLSMVTIAVLLFPTMLKANLARSDAFRASWIFFASPADRTRLIRSSKNVLVAFFLVPYLAFVGATLAYFTDSLLYVAVFVLLAGLLSHLALLIVTLADPELPFSRPVEKTGSAARIFMIMLLIGLFSAFVPLLSRWLYRSVTATAIAFAVVIGLSLVVTRLTRLRVERQAAHLEFEG